MGSERALKMGPLEWILLLVLSVLWGGSFFFVKLAVAELPPFTIVLGRVGLAALALNLLVRARGQRMPGDRGSWAAFFAMGTLNNLVPFSLIVWAQTQIASGLAAILNGATPLFTVLLAHWLTADERLTWNRLLGVALGLAGVTVMIGMEALSGLGLHVLAEVAILVATVSYAFAGIFGRRFKGQPPLVTATGQVTATTVMMLPIVLIVDRPWTLAMPAPVTLGRHRRPGAAEHRPRLRDLLPHPGGGRRHQPAAGDAADPRQRPAARPHHPRRGAGVAACPGHGADRARTGGDRWASVQGAAAAARPAGGHSAAPVIRRPEMRFCKTTPCIKK